MTTTDVRVQRSGLSWASNDGRWVFTQAGDTNDTTWTVWDQHRSDDDPTTTGFVTLDAAIDWAVAR